MKFNGNRFFRRSHRRKGYDYSLAGAFFVTINVKNRQRLLCEIKNNVVNLSKIGNIVKESWEKIPGHFKDVRLDEFVIMPDHFHGIIVIQRKPAGNSEDLCENTDNNSKRRARDLGQIVAYFKYQSTKCINQLRHTPGLPFWQKDYHEHLIRNQDEMKIYRNYTRKNPIKWTK